MIWPRDSLPRPTTAKPTLSASGVAIAGAFAAASDVEAPTTPIRPRLEIRFDIGVSSGFKTGSANIADRSP